MPTTSQNPETIVLHAGYRSDPATTAVAVPIYQTTSYRFNSTEHAANLFALKEFGNSYTRIMNPTQAASLFAVQNICHAGDNFVSSTDIYGGSWNLFNNTMKTMGIECRFVDPSDPENFRRATDARTRCYYGETLPNPKLAVFPIAEVAGIGRSLGVPLIMDNTAAPVLCQPIKHGAAMSPFNAFLFIQGLETLPLRMRQHCRNASAAAAFLAKQPKITKVIFPGLMTGEPKRRADAYFKGGYGGLVGFELKGGRAAGRKFIEKLTMFYHVANIGDARLSVGIEHIDDIVADLDQALAAV